MSEVIIAKKQEQVNLLVEKMKSSKSIVVVDYLGLSVDQFTELRSKLREEGCEIKVIKNNIVRRAAKETGYGELVESLNGPNAIAFSSEDSVAAAKVLYEFAKNNEALDMKVGIVDGDYLNNEDLNKIATIPSREVLLTMLAAGMLTPLRELAIGLNMLTEEDEQQTDEQEQTNEE